MKPGKEKKISIRKHLPLSVRVHYDTVRNFSPMKLFGVGVMALVAVFGVLLVSQAIGPNSGAVSASASGRYSAISNFRRTSSTGQKAVFNVGPKAGYTLRQVKTAAYSNTYSQCKMSHTDSRFSEVESLKLNSGSLYTASTDVIASGYKTLCVAVVVSANPGPEGLVGSGGTFADMYAFAIVSNTGNTSDAAVTVTDFKEDARGNTAAFRVRVSSGGVLYAVKFATYSDGKHACNESFDRHYGTFANKLPSVEQNRTGRTHSVQFASKPTHKRLCVKVEYKTSSSARYKAYRYFAFTINSSSADTDVNVAKPVVQVDKSGNTYTAKNTAANVAVDRWKYVIRSDSRCDGGSDIWGKSPSGNLIPVKYGSNSFAPANNEEVRKYNGKYVCFNAASLKDENGKEHWGQGGRKLSLAKVSEPEDPGTTARVESKPAPVLKVTKDGNTYTVSNTNDKVKVHRYKYVIRNDGTCDRTVFTDGGKDAGNLIKPQYTDSFSPGNNEEVRKYNGKYICFDAVATNGAWAKKKAGDKLVLDSVQEDAGAEEPVAAPQETTRTPDTGIFDDGNSAGQLIGYVLIAAAVLGTARILVVKKYKKIG